MSTAVRGAPDYAPASPAPARTAPALGTPEIAPSLAATLVRAATICLVAHAALSLFSAVAFATFLSGPPPAWLALPENQRALKIGWTFGPPTTVVLGALAGVLHAMGRLGVRRALLIFAFGFTISLGSELAGTGTGYPFGSYSYSGLLGYKIGGLVPFNIPTSWFFMLYASLAICGRVLRARDDARTKLVWAVVAGFVLTAWDVSMDPAMVRTAHWMWHLAPAAEQTTLQRIFVSDIFYGMPLSNWLGWLLTGTVVARVMLAFAPPTLWARLVAPTRFPLVLYAVNGVLPIVICFKYGMWWAAWLGLLAMGLPLALALIKGAPAEAADGVSADGARAAAGHAVQPA
ncbi:MAG TPA: carotenoid biosynthesis protein [Gemmatirosa sp.]|nr:carotenoid biosynthesis protein [Gemmatirosa sp.]